MRSSRSLALAIALCPALLFAQAYFQQRVDHVISVRLDDVAHVLHGQQSFTYTNQSPQKLDTLWIHLWPNAYRQKNTALDRQLMSMGQLDLHFASDAERGSIDSLQFTAEGIALIWGYHDEHPDIGWIKLPMPLAPASSITIDTPFRVKIPDGKFSRLGHTGQAYYITQWFPKPAVYDAQGWHAMPYLTAGEFYSEFGSYDVTITLPANYVVGATGQLQTEEERNLMDRMAGVEWVYPTPVNDLRTGKPQYNSFPASAEQMKTLRFTQDQVHDFAWFADKRFMVRKGSVTLPKSGRTVATWALFTPKNAAMWDAIGVTSLNESVRLYSEWVGDYPYDACTAVDGTISAGGGMEYPMITIIGDMGDAQSLDNVIAHEVGHNWFYGILGSNERDHAWMDEGMNSFVELRYMRERYPAGGGGFGLPLEGKLLAGLGDKHRLFNELGYRLNARRNLDQAVDIPSAGFTDINYGTMVYQKTALGFDQLFAYLGADTFDRCMHAYFEEWQFRHPGPADVRAVFERESGKDLRWLFEDILDSDRKADLRAIALEDGKVYTRVKGLRRNVPFPIHAYSGDQVIGAIWSEGRPWPPRSPSERGSWTVVDTLPWPNVDRIRIDPDARTLDIDRRNNGTRSEGLFRSWARPSLRPFTGIEKDDRRTTYYSPAFAYNAHDGFMAGIALTNAHFPAQRFEWALAPLYGTASERMAGGGRIMWHADRTRSRWFENIHTGIAANTASLKGQDDLDRWYTRVVPSITFDLRNDRAIRSTAHFVRLRSVVSTQHVEGTYEGIPRSVDQENIFHELRYDLRTRSGLSPTEASFTALHHAAFSRIQLEAKQSFIYDADDHRVVLRAFFGQFLRTDASLMQRDFGWRLYWGSADLLYDNLYVDRQDVGTLTAQQITKYQGGFKTPNSLGTSDSWIAALNMEVDAPFALPLSLFGGLGAAPTTTVTAAGEENDWATYWELGLGLRVVRDIVEIWVPLAYSPEIGDQLEFNEFEFLERIRFVFALEKLDPTTAVRRIQY